MYPIYILGCMYMITVDIMVPLLVRKAMNPRGSAELEVRGLGKVWQGPHFWLFQCWCIWLGQRCHGSLANFGSMDVKRACGIK